MGDGFPTFVGIPSIDEFAEEVVEPYADGHLKLPVSELILASCGLIAPRWFPGLFDDEVVETVGDRIGFEECPYSLSAKQSRIAAG
jgi:hypothetical protein